MAVIAGLGYKDYVTKNHNTRTYVTRIKIRVYQELCYQEIYQDQNQEVPGLLRDQVLSGSGTKLASTMQTEQRRRESRTTIKGDRTNQRIRDQRIRG